MLRLLQLLFLGHWHKWKTINECPLDLTDDGKVISRGMRYIQQCETCGIVVKRDLIGSWRVYAQPREAANLLILKEDPNEYQE